MHPFGLPRPALVAGQAALGLASWQGGKGCSEPAWMQHGGSTSGLGHGSGGTQPLWVPTLLPEVGIIPAGLGRSWVARQKGAADCGCPGGTPAPSPQVVAMVSPVLPPDGQQQPREQRVTPLRGQPGLVLQHPRKGTRVPAGPPAQQPGPPPVMRMAASPPHCPPVLSHPQPHFIFFSAVRGTCNNAFFCARSQNLQAPGSTSAASTGDFRSLLPAPAP